MSWAGLPLSPCWWFPCSCFFPHLIQRSKNILGTLDDNWLHAHTGTLRNSDIMFVGLFAFQLIGEIQRRTYHSFCVCVGGGLQLEGYYSFPLASISKHPRRGHSGQLCQLRGQLSAWLMCWPWLGPICAALVQVRGDSKEWPLCWFNLCAPGCRRSPLISSFEGVIAETGLFVMIIF